MLKIKDNVNLKELEKFEFTFDNYHNFYSKEVYMSDCRLVVDADRVLCYDNNSDADMTYHSCQLLDEVFDLIQAGLVEKIKE